MRGRFDAPAAFMLPTDQPLASLPAAFLFSRGRVIPADLEAKVIEAKQKVELSRHDSAQLSKSTGGGKWLGMDGECAHALSLCFQGYVPMYVNATAGTTVYGAFDPINEIADICEKYNMWLHVDVRSLGIRLGAPGWTPPASLLCVCVCVVCRVRGEEVCSCPGHTGTS